MMYLGIFVFVALTTTGLVRSNEEQSFSCPVCLGKTLEACDEDIEQENCSEDNPVCVLYRTEEDGQTEFERFCSSRNGYNYGRDRCDKNPQYKCSVTMCDKSGCKAELGTANSGSLVEQSFSCPSCSGKTLKDCDDNIKQENCTEEDPVCALFRSTYDDVTVFERLCYGKDSYNSVKDACDKSPKSCAVTMCDESGCKAEWANSDEGFKCPVCNVKGDQAKCDKISKLANCTQEKPICEIIKYSFGRIIRQCTDMDTYKTSLSYCEQHKNCEKAMCTESGCMAEFPSEQGEGAFTCPVCEGESLKACDDNIQNEKCREKDPVCVLSQIISLSKGVTTYRRQCSSKDNYNKDRDSCDQSFGKCSVVMCEESGCKAELPTPVTSAPLMCPVCYAEGENADSDCESIVENKPCLEEDPVCALTVSIGESADEKYRARDCFSRELYEETKDDCEYYQNCKMVMCETSGCKAEFSAPELVKPLECPFCSGKGKNAQKDCDDNITYKPCKSTDWVCGVSKQGRRFRRGCTNEKRVNNFKKFCLRPRAPKPCVNAVCNESRCKAELPVSGHFI